MGKRRQLNEYFYMLNNPLVIQRLVHIKQQADAAGHGGRAQIYEAACLELQISKPTLYRLLGRITMTTERKKRSDAGDICLSRDDAIAISGLLMASHRKNGKRLSSIGQAVSIARANGMAIAARIDSSTGEMLELSESAISRALKHYGLHPDQLNQPTPALELRSLHPNHVWQIDASLCVLYYLNARSEKEAGLQVMSHTQFYKNKPANLKKIEADRVWSYEVTDHYSGTIFVNYVMGAESSVNLIDSFLAATQKYEGNPFHGVPFKLMMDRGSANTSGNFLNLARRLGVEVIAHAAGNARATGSVEKARDIIEKSFESGLRLQPVQDLSELNMQAKRWARWFNTHKKHTRHGKSRFDVWMTISQEQLRIAPPLEHCLALVNDSPEQRKVTDKLRVNYKGQEYDVRNIPNVMIGEKLNVALNPYNPTAAVVVLIGADGQEVLHTIEVVAKDDAGFALSGNVIGEDYSAMPHTQLETNRNEVERFVMQSSTDSEAEQKRKEKQLPFGGAVDPYAVIDAAYQPTFMPKKGTNLDVTQTQIAAASTRVLTSFEACAWLKNNGIEMDREKSLQVMKWYPAGIDESELTTLKDRFTVRSKLRVVGGA